MLWLFELAHLQRQQLPSNYRQAALTRASDKKHTLISPLSFVCIFLFVWSENDIIKHE